MVYAGFVAPDVIKMSTASLGRSSIDSIVAVDCTARMEATVSPIVVSEAGCHLLSTELPHRARICARRCVVLLVKPAKGSEPLGVRGWRTTAISVLRFVDTLYGAPLIVAEPNVQNAVSPNGYLM
jgi:hypothetical protein